MKTTTCKPITRALRLLLLVLLLAAWGGVEAQNLSKIDPELLQAMQQSRDASESFKIIFSMAEQYDATGLDERCAGMTHAERRDYVVEELKRFSERSQTEISSFLGERSARGKMNKVESFWIFNGFCCESTAECVNDLSERADVAYISLDKEIQMVDPEEGEGVELAEPEDPTRSDVEWNIEKIRANEVWDELGITGEGIVIAIIDTGVNYNHADISSHMWDGGDDFPNHGWDFVNYDNDPMDDHGHGSHVAGLAAGDGTSGRKTGSAPNASIMALKVFNENANGCTTGMITSSVQFALEHGADLINMSLGAVGEDFYLENGKIERQLFENVLHVGIVAVVSAGNDGSKLSTYPIPYNVGLPGGCPPPWHHPDQILESTHPTAVITVGNVDKDDKRRPSSSIGPVSWGEIEGYHDYPYSPDNNQYGLIKPDVSAPGCLNYNSSAQELYSLNYKSNSGYCKMSGTSMSAPQVAGTVALMLETNPYLTPAKIDEILEIKAVKCFGQTQKDNYFGAGRIDAYASVTAAMNWQMPTSYHVAVGKNCMCGEVSGAGHYAPNSTCQLSASPVEHFIGWLIEGDTVPNTNYSFGVTHDMDIIGLFEGCSCIHLTANLSEAAASGSGWGYYFDGETCVLDVTPNPGYVFMNYTIDGQIMGTDPHLVFTVNGSVDYVANFGRICTVNTNAFPSDGGTVTGPFEVISGEQCTVTATPNLGYAFKGWYRQTPGFEAQTLVSRQPEYTFTVRMDEVLVAMFEQRNFTVNVTPYPASGGSVTGNIGSVPANTQVTLTAHPAAGYFFSCWMENGHAVSGSPVYSFLAQADRNLMAMFTSSNLHGIGDVITAPDGSQGVVFSINEFGTGGTMVALTDASVSCPWDENYIDLVEVENHAPVGADFNAMADMAGYSNTEAMRLAQGTGTGYAADVVDFAHGWYLPSVGQLRKLYGALPFFDSICYQHGGTTLAEGHYWTSSEHTLNTAWSPEFAMGTATKSDNLRVRAVREFSFGSDFMVDAAPNSETFGSVGGMGCFFDGGTAMMIANPAEGYDFVAWHEDGNIVSYDRVYTFPVHSNRYLVAEFTQKHFVGQIVTNLDGSQGVVFALNDDGLTGYMVRLTDVAPAIQWGPDADVGLLENAQSGIHALNDDNGFFNTYQMRQAMGTDNTYAASVVDFENGWFLPSAGQLRKLYAALPFIEDALVRAGGAALTEDAYWSSSESNSITAFDPMFAMNTAYKSSELHVRSIRKFVYDEAIVVTVNNEEYGTAALNDIFGYNYGETAVVRAFPNDGYVFDHWSEDGVFVSNEQNYFFAYTRGRTLQANFKRYGEIGSLITNADGSQGVVFYHDQDGISGYMVALEDASEGCQWGPDADVGLLENAQSGIHALNDDNGFFNTYRMRQAMGTDNTYAASVVDFENGWFLPSAGQLRKLYAALPFIEDALVRAGGAALTEDAYWSSSENNASTAFDPMFAMNTAAKSSSQRLRAIRKFYFTNTVVVSADYPDFGTAAVSGSSPYEVGESVTVSAVANEGYAFDHWSEEGVYLTNEPSFTFTFEHSRSLVAHFTQKHYVGQLMTNFDGSKGVVFYLNNDESMGYMVALEDASDGCQWGPNEDVPDLPNMAPTDNQQMLYDLSGYANTTSILYAQSHNPDYAASKVDISMGWYLPSAGQLRKLYAALPMVEPAIVNAGGTLMADAAYWSSTENSANNAWTPSFAFGTTGKTGSCRVRGVRTFYFEGTPPPTNDKYIFIASQNNAWEDLNNWQGHPSMLPGASDDVIINGYCCINDHVAVKNLTVNSGATLNLGLNQTLQVSNRLSTSSAGRIVMEHGAQLFNPTNNAYVTLKHDVSGYGSGTSWHFIATPMKNGTGVSAVTTGNYDLYAYDEPTYFWKSQKQDENGLATLEFRRGYLYANSAFTEMSFAGQVIPSNAVTAVRVSNTASAEPLNGFNLIGNPYTRNLYIDEVSQNGTPFTAFYMVRGGDAIMAYTSADGMAIRPAEGFMVQCSEGWLNFNGSSRGGAEKGSYLRFVLYADTTMLDRAYVNLGEGDELNKMAVRDTQSLICFERQGQQYAIVNRPMEELVLGFHVAAEGDYTLCVDFLNTDGKAVIRDTMTGKTFSTGTYTFHASPGDTTGRFVIEEIR